MIACRQAARLLAFFYSLFVLLSFFIGTAIGHYSLSQRIR